MYQEFYLSSGDFVIFIAPATKFALIIIIEMCQNAVSEAITTFLEGESFEDVVRTAVSLGGDFDILTCIAGTIAEGFYGVPEDLKQECRNRLPDELREVLEWFDQVIGRS